MSGCENWASAARGIWRGSCMQTRRVPSMQACGNVPAPTNKLSLRRRDLRLLRISGAGEDGACQRPVRDSGLDSWRRVGTPAGADEQRNLYPTLSGARRYDPAERVLLPSRGPAIRRDVQSPHAPVLFCKTKRLARIHLRTPTTQARICAALLAVTHRMTHHAAPRDDNGSGVGAPVLSSLQAQITARAG